MAENSVEITQFLATSLARFMATNQLNHQKWTKIRVAEFITGHDEIQGAISDTTIGRFLDPAHHQKPSLATIQMVKDFLLYFEFITERQLELHQYSKQVRAAAAFGDFFTPDATKDQIKLYKKLDGHYANYIVRPPYVLESRLYLTNHEDTQLLTCFEILTLFKTANLQQLHNMSSKFLRGDFDNANTLIRMAGGQEVARHVMSGAVVASSGLVALMMKPLTSGFFSISTIDAINMNDDDKVCALNGTRNRGWTILEETERLAAFEDVSGASPYNALRHLCGKLSYYPQFFEAIQSRRVAVCDEDYKDKGRREFASSEGVIEDKIFQNQRKMDNTRQHIEKAKTLDEKMRLSVEWGDLECFTEALNDGANPNMILQDSGLPIIFYLASTGRFEWVKVLVNTGACDLKVTDEKGMPPSYYPSLVAREIVTQNGPDHQVKQFEDLANYLLTEESKQLQSAPSGISPPER